MFITLFNFSSARKILRNKKRAMLMDTTRPAFFSLRVRASNVAVADAH